MSELFSLTESIFRDAIGTEVEEDAAKSLWAFIYDALDLVVRCRRLSFEGKTENFDRFGPSGSSGAANSSSPSSFPFPKKYSFVMR